MTCGGGRKRFPCSAALPRIDESAFGKRFHPRFASPPSVSLRALDARFETSTLRPPFGRRDAPHHTSAFQARDMRRHRRRPAVLGVCPRLSRDLGPPKTQTATLILPAGPTRFRWLAPAAVLTGGWQLSAAGPPPLKL